MPPDATRLLSQLFRDPRRAGYGKDRMPPDSEDGQITVINEPVSAVREQPLQTFALDIVAGPDTGKSFVVESNREGRMLVGQSPVCSVRLADPKVSRRHAAIELASGALRVSDLGSTNGTLVNGLRVYDAVVTGGETIQVGETVLRVTPRSDLAEPDTNETNFGTFVGASAEIRRLYPTMARIAASTIPIVIEGETGTGKEVLAESLHEQGPRASGPFVVFDCTTIAPNLMEATLFGYERGAFTGAVTATPGLFEEADKGTLFIDEIGDLDITLQSKLLRAIERSEIR